MVSNKDIKRQGPYADSPANVKTGAWRQRRPVVSAECVGCQLCVGYCPTGVITLQDKRAEIDYTYCKGCGVCPTVCPKGAITMVPDDQGV